MEREDLWNRFATTGDIHLYLAFKEQERKQKGDRHEGSKDSRDRDRGSFHG